MLNWFTRREAEDEKHIGNKLARRPLAEIVVPEEGIFRFQSKIGRLRYFVTGTTSNHVPPRLYYSYYSFYPWQLTETPLHLNFLFTYIQKQQMCTTRNIGGYQSILRYSRSWRCTDLLRKEMLEIATPPLARVSSDSIMNNSIALINLSKHPTKCNKFYRTHDGYE